jgi:eukaryotic-like serine/threonine-protein kinase
MMLSAGDIVADKYCIERLIGEGGMGTVYAATNQLTGRTVALKWLRGNLASDELLTQRFMREARVAGRLDHPSIVSIFDVGKHGDAVFLVMELLKGEPFDVWLRKEARAPHECIGLLMPALRAVSAAHEVGVVHRDLKPENIFICMDVSGKIRQTKVLDFGIAKELGPEDPATSSLTSPGSIVGTIHYMAPEQVRNSRFADVRSDVYSLGIILYNALGGGLPFDAESLGELIIEIADGTPEPLHARNPEIPLELSEIVMRAISRDAGDRFQTVAELAGALEPFSAGARFDSLRAPALGTGAPTSRDFPMSKTGKTLASAASGEHRAPNRIPKAFIIGPTLVGLAIAVYVSMKGGSWLLSGGEANTAAASVPSATVASPAVPATDVEPAAPRVAEARPVASETVELPTPVASATQASPGSAVPQAGAFKGRPSKTPRAATAPVPASAAPAPPPPKPAPGSAYEQNPYLRR